jgi:hypothetical protein
MVMSDPIEHGPDTAAPVAGRMSILVHGGGSSLGQAVVQELVRAGATIGIWDTGEDPAVLERLRAEAQEAGGDVRPIRIPGGEDAAAQVAAAADQMGGITAVINLFVPDPRAGLGPLRPTPRRCWGAAWRRRGRSRGRRPTGRSSTTASCRPCTSARRWRTTCPP